MPLTLEIGNNVINSFVRLSYTPWHAIAEFVDNSTQSFFDNSEILKRLANPNQRPLEVKIFYDLENGILRIEDNAMGMSFDELSNALKVAKPPENPSGRSRYGMGLKTAACWIGKCWTITTKKYGETNAYKVTVVVDEIAKGNTDLPFDTTTGLLEDQHYTIIEINNHNRPFKGKTLRKIQDYLSSMYREDFRKGILTLLWNGTVLEWAELEDRILVARDGTKYKRSFNFEISEEGKYRLNINGWVGVLAAGSRKDAGFSILHSGRVVKGWPDAWRPSTLYGQIQGSNDLVNQRLVGEINLDDFEISHTKDDIQWLGDQEEQVENGLYEQCKDYREVAKSYRTSVDDTRGPSTLDTTAAISEFQKELESKELIDIVSTDPMLTEELVKEVVETILTSVQSIYTERFKASINDLSVKGYIEEMSINDPYITIEATKGDEVIIIVNSSHPHWKQLQGSEGVLNYLRHCTYDGIAEWQARQKIGTIDPDTIKILKDRLLRLSLEIEKHSVEE